MVWHNVESNVITNSFIAPSITRRAWEHVPPCLAIDGCHARGVHDYIILFATCLDSNNHIVVLAWGHCLVEDEDSWRWFIHRLSSAYPSMNRKGVTIISDRQKGITAPVHYWFHNAYHGHCVYHIQQNVRTKFGRGIERHVKPLAYATDAASFKRLMDKLREINDKAAHYIERIDHDRWARYRFNSPRFGRITSSSVEATNAIFKAHRASSIIQLFDSIWTWQSLRWHDRASEAASIPFSVVPHIKARLDDAKAESIRYSVVLGDTHDGETSAKVVPGAVVDHSENERLVAINPARRQSSCTCLTPTDLLIPCRHAIAVIAAMRLLPKDFVHHCHSIEAYRSTYQHRFPLVLVDDLQAQPALQPPPMRKGKGRRVEKRYEPGQVPSAASQVRGAAPPSRELSQPPQAIKQRRCRNCGRLARHNARTCPWPKSNEPLVEIGNEGWLY